MNLIIYQLLLVSRHVFRKCEKVNVMIFLKLLEILQWVLVGNTPRPGSCWNFKAFFLINRGENVR